MIDAWILADEKPPTECQAQCVLLYNRSRELLLCASTEQIREQWGTIAGESAIGPWFWRPVELPRRKPTEPTEAQRAKMQELLAKDRRAQAIIKAQRPAMSSEEKRRYDELWPKFSRLMLKKLTEENARAIGIEWSDAMWMRELFISGKMVLA